MLFLSAAEGLFFVQCDNLCYNEWFDLNTGTGRALLRLWVDFTLPR